MKSTLSSHGSDDNPSIKPLRLRSTLKAFDDSVLSEDEPPSEADTRKEPFRVSSFRITKSTDGKTKSEQQGEAKQEPEPESKSAASASNLDFLLDSDSDLEPDSASRPDRRETQRMEEPSTASEGTSYAFSADQGGPLPAMMAPTALDEYALVPAPGYGYDPFETAAYDAFNAGYNGYAMDPSYGQYPVQYADPYSTVPGVYAPPQLMGYDGYGMPIMQYTGYPAQYEYAMPYGYAAPPAGYGYPQPMPQPQDWADTLYQHPMQEPQQYAYSDRRGSLRSDRSDTVDARAAQAAAQAVRRATLGSGTFRPTFGSAPTGR